MSAPNTRGQIGLGMTGHHAPHRGANDEWLTPPEILQALGPFDLDPCAPVVRPWPMAAEHYTEGGLSKPWHGFVWCNPPYGPQTGKWLAKLAAHGNGIALIFARTETADFFAQVWEKADAILFLRGRLHFHYVDGSRAKANAGAPSCLVAYGAEAERRLLSIAERGQLVPLAGRFDKNTTGVASCPFCASSSVVVTSNGEENIFASCCDCGGEGPAASTRAEAIAAWNRRSARSA